MMRATELPNLRALFADALSRRLLCEKAPSELNYDEATRSMDALYDAMDEVYFAAVNGREDSDRLDWIDANCSVVTHQVLFQWPNMNGDDLRTTVDRARGNSGEVPAASAPEDSHG